MNRLPGRRIELSPAMQANMRKIFALVGLVVLVFGLAWGQRTRTAVRTWSRASGTVVDVERVRSDDGFKTVLTIGFTDASGEEREMKPLVSSSTRDGAGIGDRFSVLYDPRSRKAVVEDFSDLWAMPIFLSGFGIIFVLVGLFGKPKGAKPLPSAHDPVARVEQDEPPAPLIR